MPSVCTAKGIIDIQVCIGCQLQSNRCSKPYLQYIVQRLMQSSDASSMKCSLSAGCGWSYICSDKNDSCNLKRLWPQRPLSRSSFRNYSWRLYKWLLPTSLPFLSLSCSLTSRQLSHCQWEQLTCFANSLSFFSSSLWKRVFSSSRTCTTTGFGQPHLSPVFQNLNLFLQLVLYFFSAPHLSILKLCKLLLDFFSNAVSCKEHLKASAEIE